MKEVLGIWAVALVVTFCGFFYMNTSLDAMRAENDSIGLVDVSDLKTTAYPVNMGAAYESGGLTIPRLQVSKSVVVSAYDYQNGADVAIVQTAANIMYVE